MFGYYIIKHTMKNLSSSCFGVHPKVAMASAVLPLVPAPAVLSTSTNLEDKVSSSRIAQGSRAGAVVEGIGTVMMQVRKLANQHWEALALSRGD